MIIFAIETCVATSFYKNSHSLASEDGLFVGN